MDVAVSSSALVTGLNAAVLAVCLVLKVPQMIKVLSAKSTAGISVRSLLLEIWCFNLLLAYPCANGYPVFGYLEFFFLSAQDYLLLFLILRDRNQLNIQTVSCTFLFISFIGGLSFNFLSSHVLYLLTVSVTPCAAVGKLLQIWTIWSLKDSGAVSSLTWALGTFSSSARIVTQSLTAADPLLLLISGQATLLNGAIFVCSVYYKPKPKDS